MASHLGLSFAAFGEPQKPVCPNRARQSVPKWFAVPFWNPVLEARFGTPDPHLHADGIATD